LDNDHGDHSRQAEHHEHLPQLRERVEREEAAILAPKQRRRYNTREFESDNQ
jgi:hypothetical protein